MTDSLFNNPTDHHGLQNPYHAENVRTVKAVLKQFAEEQAKKKLIAMLVEVATRMIKEIEDSFVPLPPYHRKPESGNAEFPVWCGEMHDATGVGIYNDSVVMSYLPIQKHDDCGGQHDPPYEKIIGREWLKDAIALGQTQFSKGVWIVLFSSVPYANLVNTCGSPAARGKGYFDTLSDHFYKDIVKGLKAISPNP